MDILAENTSAGYREKGSPVEPGELKKILGELESAESTGDKISLYIPPGKEMADVLRFLDKEYEAAVLIPDRAKRESHKGSVADVISALRARKLIPKNGLAVFCNGHTEGHDTGHRSCIVIEPPVPVPAYLYRCSGIFEPGPLRAMLTEESLSGLIVIDRNVAWWGITDGNRVEPLGDLTSLVPAKQKKGGQSAPRFQRLREIAVHEFFTRVGEKATADFRASDGFVTRFHGVLIGGPGSAAAEFAAGSYLPHEIRTRITGMFDIEDVGINGLDALAVRAKEILRASGISDGTRAMEAFRAALALGNGLASYGETVVRKNLADGAVGTLILSSSLRRSGLHVTCGICGHSDERTFDLTPGESVDSILAHTCRTCPAPIIKDGRIDLIDELSGLADSSGAKTMIVPYETDAGKDLSLAFGGIAALLRYPDPGSRDR